MEAIFMKTQNSEANEFNELINLLTSLILKTHIMKKNIGLVNLSIDYTWKNFKSTYNNDKIKISASTWNDEFD